LWVGSAKSSGRARFLIASLWAEASTSTLGRARAEHFHQISQDIELRLGDCELSLGKVADVHHVSSRYIQKLFGEAGFSFSQYLRLRRLEHCRADLSSRAHEALSISEICFRWGFNDAAHFSRSFRNQYQTTPREYRQQFLGEPVGAAGSQKALHVDGRSLVAASVAA
jgi:AraC-like DNA-binding protein